MKKTLLSKDLRLLLKDLKFQIFFLILVILFILSAVSSAVNYKNQSQQFQADLASHNERVNDGRSTQMIKLLNYAHNLFVYSRPSPALLFSDYDNYPDKVASDVSFYTPTFQKYGATASEVFRLNWYFILGILAGFIMLIMSFEAISAEKRAGTLRLVTIYGFKRQTILWYKYLSYMLLYLIIILPPALISLVVFFALTGTWSLDFMLRFLVILVISVPFASFFVLLGTFISMAKNYRSAIVMVVFIWLLFVIIIPQSANIIGKQLSPLMTKLDYQEMRHKAMAEEWSIWQEEHGNSVSGNHLLSEGWRAKAVNARDERNNQGLLTELDDSLRQIRIIEAIASLSPFTQFERISEIVFDKGSYLFGYLQEATKRSINQIKNLLIEQDSRNETSLHLYYSWAESDGRWDPDNPPFSNELFEHPDLLFVSEIPTDEGLVKVMKVLWRLLPILILNLLLVIFCVVKLERLDIR